MLVTPAACKLVEKAARGASASGYFQLKVVLDTAVAPAPIPPPQPRRETTAQRLAQARTRACRNAARLRSLTPPRDRLHVWGPTPPADSRRLSVETRVRALRPRRGPQFSFSFARQLSTRLVGKRDMDTFQGGEGLVGGVPREAQCCRARWLWKHVQLQHSALPQEAPCRARPGGVPVHGTPLRRSPATVA